MMSFSSICIHHCLLCSIVDGPYNYFSYASCHTVKLVQQTVQEGQWNRKKFYLPSSGAILSSDSFSSASPSNSTDSLPKPPILQHPVPRVRAFPGTPQNSFGMECPHKSPLCGYIPWQLLGKKLGSEGWNLSWTISSDNSEENFQKVP